MHKAIEPAQIQSMDAFDEALKAIVVAAVAQGLPHGTIMARTLRRVSQTLAAEYGTDHAAMVLRFAARVLEDDPARRRP